MGLLVVVVQGITYHISHNNYTEAKKEQQVFFNVTAV